MVDVSAKQTTTRTATAEGSLRINDTVRELLRNNAVPKGNVFAVAKVAGIMAAKRTAELIPMCHTLPLESVEIEISLVKTGVRITATAVCTGKTGVEMEAMTACTVAALTIYDMCKAADKGIVIESVRLIAKTGGKSGDWRRAESPDD